LDISFIKNRDGLFASEVVESEIRMILFDYLS